MISPTRARKVGPGIGYGKAGLGDGEGDGVAFRPLRIRTYCGEHFTELLASPGLDCGGSLNSMVSFSSLNMIVPRNTPFCVTSSGIVRRRCFSGSQGTYCWACAGGAYKSRTAAAIKTARRMWRPTSTLRGSVVALFPRSPLDEITSQSLTSNLLI